MGNCKSDPTFHQLENFVTKRLNRMLTQRSIRIQNQLHSIRDEDYIEKLIKLVKISLKQNRYFYDQLQEIFEKFGFILPQKFMSVQNFYSQELKELLKKFKEQYHQKISKLTQQNESIRDLVQKISFLENMRFTTSQIPKVELISKDQQQINRLNRIILKHQKNTQNDKKLISQLKSQIQHIKVLLKQKQNVQKENEKIQIENKQLKYQIEGLKRQNTFKKEQNQLDQNKQNSLNPQMDNKSTNFQQKQKEFQAKQLQLNQKINQLVKFQVDLKLKDQQIFLQSEKLKLLKIELNQKSDFLQNLEKQLIRKQLNSTIDDQLRQSFQKQTFERNTHIANLENNIQKLQQSLTKSQKYQDELKQMLKKKEQIIRLFTQNGKKQQKSNQTLNKEQTQIHTTNFQQINKANENKINNDLVQNFRISDQNKAEVHQILTRKLSFTPWKGFLNKFVLDLGITLNGGLTYGLYRKSQFIVKKQYEPYTQFF